MVGDTLVDEITKFIENFSFDKNTENDEVRIKNTYIRFDNKCIDK